MSIVAAGRMPSRRSGGRVSGDGGRWGRGNRQCGGGRGGKGRSGGRGGGRGRVTAVAGGGSGSGTPKTRSSDNDR